MNFDLIVIGGGPAGIIAASTAVRLGKRVALIDSEPELGGAGTNTGTVPSKTLRETALALSGMRSRNLYGVDLSLRREATVADFLRHEVNVKEGMNHALAARMENSKVDVFKGEGAFEGPHTVRVNGGETRLSGEFIVLATGSSPTHPKGVPFDWPEVYDSDKILTLDRLPASLAVIGAGVIGSEYGCTFAALGTKVHIIDGRDALLPFLDREVSAELTRGMEKIGIAFHWKEHAEFGDVRQEGAVSLKLSSGEVLTVDAVLMAAGRTSNVGKLNLAAAGIVPGEHGLITVNEHYQTTTPHIYAAGDVIGFPALASTSMEQARRAVRHAFLNRNGRALTMLPSGVYTIPEVSMIGETEESLQHANVQFVAGRGRYGSTARGRIIGDSDGFLKLLFRREDMKLLGVHAIGEQATELVHIGLMAMLNNCDAEIFDEACFNIPTLGQLYKIATLDALNQTGAPAAVQRM